MVIASIFVCLYIDDYNTAEVKKAFLILFQIAVTSTDELKVPFIFTTLINMAEIPTTTVAYQDDANTSTGTPATPNGTVLAFQNLIPALVQCFTIILFGYIAGRTRIVCPSQAKGLGHYVSYFALPAMLFKSMVELDFSEVRKWQTKIYTKIWLIIDRFIPCSLV